jgi:hypothetical protein
MGIDVHGLRFLQYAKTFGDFNKTITIGRQEIYAPESFVRGAVNAGSDYRNEKYCEPLLLKFYGASAVDSVDNSAFDGAPIIHDMNLTLPSNLEASYDTVIDGGCLEHIYNLPQALQNCSRLCKPGGQILHILPANNFCGHGFWQFSPELFFSLYSNRNGYRDTEVFLADLSNTTKWFKVSPPQDGHRVDVICSTEVYALVRTVLREASFSHNNVQQSDYAFAWTNDPEKKKANAPAKPNKIRQFLKKTPLYPFIALRRHLIARQMIRRKLLASQLNGRNPGLTEINIRSLL